MGGVLAGIGVFLITLCFSVGNAVGSGVGLSMLVPGTSPVMWDDHLHRPGGAIDPAEKKNGVVEKVLIVHRARSAFCFIASAFLEPD